MKNISLETTINDFSFTGDLNWTSEAVENIIKIVLNILPIMES